jgi:hypothetical protein
MTRKQTQPTKRVKPCCPITSTPESLQAILDEVIADRNAIVQLDPDHPGFRDPNIAAAAIKSRKSR